MIMLCFVCDHVMCFSYSGTLCISLATYIKSIQVVVSARRQYGDYIIDLLHTE